MTSLGSLCNVGPAVTFSPGSRSGWGLETRRFWPRLWISSRSAPFRLRSTSSVTETPLEHWSKRLPKARSTYMKSEYPRENIPSEVLSRYGRIAVFFSQLRHVNRSHGNAYTFRDNANLHVRFGDMSQCSATEAKAEIALNEIVFLNNSEFGRLSQRFSSVFLWCFVNVCKCQFSHAVLLTKLHRTYIC